MIHNNMRQLRLALSLHIANMFKQPSPIPIFRLALLPSFRHIDQRVEQEEGFCCWVFQEVG